MSRPLEELDAAKAGVSQAELEDAFLSLGTLVEEKDQAEAALESALTVKREAKEALKAANENLKEVLALRDPIAEEWARADWIVRNADPDQPPPPLGSRPPGIKSKRG